MRAPDCYMATYNTLQGPYGTPTGVAGPHGIHTRVCLPCRNVPPLGNRENGLEIGLGLHHFGSGLQHEDFGLQHEGFGLPHEGFGLQHAGFGLQHAGSELSVEPRMGIYNTLLGPTIHPVVY